MWWSNVCCLWSIVRWWGMGVMAPPPGFWRIARRPPAATERGPPMGHAEMETFWSVFDYFGAEERPKSPLERGSKGCVTRRKTSNYANFTAFRPLSLLWEGPLVPRGLAQRGNLFTLPCHREERSDEAIPIRYRVRLLRSARNDRGGKGAGGLRSGVYGLMSTVRWG